MWELGLLRSYTLYTWGLVRLYFISVPSRPAVRAVDCTTSCGMWLPHALGMRLPSPHQGACTKGEGAGKAPCCSTAHRLARISLSAQANRNASLGARKCQRCRSIGPLMSLLCLGLPRGAGSLCSRIKPHMKSYMSTTTCNDIVVVNYKKNGIGKEANRQSSAAGKENGAGAARKEIGAVGRLERKSGLGRQERKLELGRPRQAPGSGQGRCARARAGACASP
jgi:hypothetical protein